MKVYFVGAGPGDPELVTRKGQRLLERCGSCIYAGSLVNPRLLDLLSPEAERHDSAAMSLEEITEVYRRAREREVDVVRLHSGDPSIFGAVGEQMRELDRLGIEYEVVPGVSSFAAAAAALKTPLTAPEVSQTIILTRTAGRTPVPEAQSLNRLAQARATLCLFLSVHRVKTVAEQLAKHYGADCPAAVVYRASWPDERVIRGTLADVASKVAEAGIERTALVLVGRALGRPEGRSKLYDEAFEHDYREGSE